MEQIEAIKPGPKPRKDNGEVDKRRRLPLKQSPSSPI